MEANVSSKRGNKEFQWKTIAFVDVAYDFESTLVK